MYVSIYIYICKYIIHIGFTGLKLGFYPGQAENQAFVKPGLSLGF